MASNSPIPTSRLRQICNDACDAAISSASVYEHSQTQGWNNAIINNILKALISESQPTSSATSSTEAQPTAAVPQYKFIVNTTIIQHLSDPRPGGEPLTPGEDASLAQSRKVGRRGMHSASGAFWNNEKDGMWSYKFEGGEQKGMDIVISVMWIAV